MKKLRLLVLLLFSLTLSACSTIEERANHQDTWNKIQKQKKIVVGLDDSFVPMGFEKKNGQLTGYDIDLAKKVFAIYKIKVDFQIIDWSMNVTELRNGTIDLIWNGFSITKERAEKVAFSRPYLKNDQVLVVKKNSPITSFSQMKNYQLGLQTGSTAQQWYDSKQKLLKAKQTVLYDQIPNAFLDLRAGRIQGILLDKIYAQYYLAHLKEKNYRIIVNKRVPADLFAVGIRKGDKTLTKKINQALVKLQKNGELAKLNQKWFGTSSNYLGQVQANE